MVRKNWVRSKNFSWVQANVTTTAECLQVLEEVYTEGWDIINVVRAERSVMAWLRLRDDGSIR